MPFGSHLTVDTLPSEVQQAVAPGPPWQVSSFRLRARLDVSIPSAFFGQRGITPAFGYGDPHSSARGTLTLLNNALLNAQYLNVWFRRLDVAARRRTLRMTNGAVLAPSVRVVAERAGISQLPTVSMSEE